MATIYDLKFKPEGRVFMLEYNHIQGLKPEHPTSMTNINVLEFVIEKR